MSGNPRPSSDRPAPDRRVERSRAALLRAFNQLILERGFDALTAADVADAANVARSTFYAHYNSLSELLSVAIGPILAPLAHAAVGDSPGLIAMLDHIWENRVMARSLLAGDNRRPLVQLLASQIEAHMVEAGGACGGKISLWALQVAGGQLTLLELWLCGRLRAPPTEIAEALRIPAALSSVVRSPP